MKDRLVYAIKLIIGLVSFFSIGIITRFILSLFNINMSTLSDKNLLIIEVVISIIMFIILLLLYYKEIKEDFKLFKSDLSKNISYVVKMFIIFIIVKYVISIISVLILMGLGYEVDAINSVNQNYLSSYQGDISYTFLIGGKYSLKYYLFRRYLISTFIIPSFICTLEIEKECYPSCSQCIDYGDSNDHKCTSCKSELWLLENTQNCLEENDLPEGYYKSTDTGDKIYKK